MDQPDSVIKRLEIVMRIRDEEHQKAMSNHGPPGRQ
jgi:hypothetical protein